MLGADRSEVAARDEEKRVRFHHRKVPGVSLLGRERGGVEGRGWGAGKSRCGRRSRVPDSVLISAISAPWMLRFHVNLGIENVSGTGQILPLLVCITLHEQIVRKYG
jgi:hypothetical protein